MKYKVTKGSVFPVEIDIKSIGVDVDATKKWVNVQCMFYAIEPQVPPPPETVIGKYRVGKIKISSSSTYYAWTDELFLKDDKIVAIVDSTDLNVGFLYAQITIEYDDQELNGSTEISQTIPVETDVIITSSTFPLQ